MNFDKYNFDQRLKDLQDSVLTLNYRVDQPISNPTMPQPVQNFNQNYNYNQPHPIQQYAQQNQQQQQYQQEDDEDDDDYEYEQEEDLQNVPMQNQQSTNFIQNQSELANQPFQQFQQGYNRPQQPRERQYQTQGNTQDQDNQVVNNQLRQHRNYIQNLNQDEEQKETQIFSYLEQQNKLIKSIADKMNDDKQQEYKQQQKIQEDDQRQIELEDLKKQVYKRQDIMINNLRAEFQDKIHQRRDEKYPQNYDQNEMFYNIQKAQQPPPYGYPNPFDPYFQGPMYQPPMQMPYPQQPYPQQQPPFQMPYPQQQMQQQPPFQMPYTQLPNQQPNIHRQNSPFQFKDRNPDNQPNSFFNVGLRTLQPNRPIESMDPGLKTYQPQLSTSKQIIHSRQHSQNQSKAQQLVQKNNSKIDALLDDLQS